MEFYAAMKKNEIISFAGKWMELENIILSEVRLAQNWNTLLNKQITQGFFIFLI
jgi:hypothetical protein